MFKVNNKNNRIISEIYRNTCQYNQPKDTIMK